MARAIKQGQHIFIAFQNGESVLDSQLRPRMYKSVEQFKKSFPGREQGEVELVEYAPTLTPPNEPLSVLVNDEPDREYIDYICPRCKDIISQRRRGQRMETVYQCKYHDNCGQRMDWSNPQPYRRPPEAKDNNVPTNEPLTIEELLKMDGEPVYVVFRPDGSGERSQSWALVNVDEKYGEVYLVDSIPGASCYYDEIWADLEGIYRRPPEGEEDA